MIIHPKFIKINTQQSDKKNKDQKSNGCSHKKHIKEKNALLKFFYYLKEFCKIIDTRL